MSDTAPWRFSHIHRLLGTDLEDLLFLHYMPSPFCAIPGTDDFEMYRNIMRMANHSKTCYTTTHDPTQIAYTACGKRATRYNSSSPTRSRGTPSSSPRPCHVNSTMPSHQRLRFSSIVRVRIRQGEARLYGTRSNQGSPKPWWR